MVTILQVRSFFSQADNHENEWRYSNIHIPNKETAVPYTMFKSTDYEIKFATENGKAPQCDKKMLEGFTQKLLVTTDLTTSRQIKANRSAF